MKLSDGYSICRTTGKRSHSTRVAAKEHLSSLKTANDYQGYIYPCPSCGMYHVGRVKLRAHKNKYAK